MSTTIRQVAGQATVDITTNVNHVETVGHSVTISLGVTTRQNPGKAPVEEEKFMGMIEKTRY
jgi:hypothetical protein